MRPFQLLVHTSKNKAGRSDDDWQGEVALTGWGTPSGWAVSEGRYRGSHLHRELRGG